MLMLWLPAIQCHVTVLAKSPKYEAKLVSYHNLQPSVCDEQGIYSETSNNRPSEERLTSV